MRMADYVKYIGRFLIIDIEKPIFTGDYVSRVMINKEYIDKASYSSRYLVVRVPKGEIIFFPKTMKKMKIIKKVFKRPDDPMKMVELDIPHCEKRPREFFEVS